MSIGSFLSSAGAIQASSEEYGALRELQRAQRAQAQAQQLELARRERSRQQAEGRTLADYVGAAPTYDSLAPPMDVVEGEFPQQPPAAPPPAPGVAPFPASSVPPMLAKPPATTATRRAGVAAPPGSLAERVIARREARVAGQAGGPKVGIQNLFDKLGMEPAKPGETPRVGLQSLRAKFGPKAKEAPAAKAPAAKAAATKAPAPAPAPAADQPQWDQQAFMMKVGGPQGVEAGGQWIDNKEGSSSAFGPAQITDDTWVFHYNRVNPKSGLSKDQILALKKDRSVYPQVFQALTTYNQQQLQRGGFPVNDTNMYMMHFLGATGGPAALKFLQQDPNTPITQAIGADARAANATLLKGKKTIGDVYNWAASKMGEAASSRTQSAGLDETGGAQEPPRRMAPSEFYLNSNRPEMISAGTSAALQSRKRLEAIADRYRQEGRLDEFDAVLMQIDAQDNNLRMLQGMQGISELAYSRNPSRLAAVWSDYAGTPIQIQPRTDGKYNILSGGQAIAQGVDQQTLIDQARMTFDQAYLQQRTENQNAMMLKRFELQFGMDKDMALKAMDAVKDIQVAQINGQAGIARQREANLNGIISNSPGGQSWFLRGGNVSQLVSDYRPPGAPESVPAGPAMIRVDAGAA